MAKYSYRNTLLEGKYMKHIHQGLIQGAKKLFKNLKNFKMVQKQRRIVYVLGAEVHVNDMHLTSFYLPLVNL